MKKEDTENILGYPVTTKNIDDCVDQIVSWVKDKEKGKYFVCANPHCLEIAESDPLYKQAMLKADMIIPDGVGILIASWILNGNIRKRITGSDVFRELNRTLDMDGGCRYFFLGSTKDKLDLLCDKVKSYFPNIQIAGSYSPPFKPDFTTKEDTFMIESINQARPDILWIGMTAPKQEKWIYQNGKKLDVKCIAPVGAVFDFYIDAVKRSHPWFLKHGLEWLPRLLREPKRLWKRMFISAPKFMARVMKQKISM